MSYVSISRDGKTSSYSIDHENNKAQYKSWNEVNGDLNANYDPSKFRATVIMTSRAHSVQEQPRNEFESSTFRIVVDGDLQSASSSNLKSNTLRVFPLENPNPDKNRNSKSANLTVLRDLSLAHHELEFKLNKTFPKASRLNKLFLTYLEEKSISSNDIKNIEKLTPNMFYDNELVKKFSEDKKLQEVLMTITKMNEEDSKLIKLSWTPVILDEISVEMLFNPEKLEEFLYKKIDEFKVILETTRQKDYLLHDNNFTTKKLNFSQISPSNLNNELYSDIQKNSNLEQLETEKSKKDLEKVLETNFPDAKEVTERFIKFLSVNSSAEIFQTYTDDVNKIFNMSDPIIFEFYKENFGEFMQNILMQIDPRNYAVIARDLNKIGAFKNSTIEMIFKPNQTINILNEKFCTFKVENELSLKVEPLRNSNPSSSWGKTPQKCIIYEICKKITISSWNQDEVESQIKNYLKPIEMTFDEVDDFFFDLVDEAIEKRNRENPTKLDKDCIISYIKRNDEYLQMYNINLLSYSEAFENVLSKIVQNYQQKFVNT